MQPLKPPKILDNKQQGRVIDELRLGLKQGAKLAVISAYFTIYAYEVLKKELSGIEEMRFIFTTPSYIKQKNDFQREFYIAHRDMGNRLSGNDFELKLRNKLTQSAIAKECADWLRQKVRIKSYRETNLAQMRLAYVENADPEADIAIQGTVDFTSDGLGITPSARNDMNTCMYGRSMTQGFLQSFEGIWNNPAAVEDVTEKVLSEMEVLYKENTPELSPFTTFLRHISANSPRRPSSRPRRVSKSPLSGTSSTSSSGTGSWVLSTKSRNTAAALSPTAWDWERLSRLLPSSNTTNFEMTGCWCLPPRNCERTGRYTPKTTSGTSLPLTVLIGKKQEVGVASLFSKGGTAMPQSFDDGMADFELVDFVVLK